MNPGLDFEKAALPHLDAIWSLARRLCRDGRDVEDLVQETFLRAFAAFDTWRGGDVQAWLAVICLNTARSLARRRRCRPYEVTDANGGERPAPDDPSEEATDRVRRGAVERALAGLPTEQRHAIELMDIAGLSAQAVANMLGCPRGTVLARVHRGRRRLVGLLDAEGVRDAY
jgi:RNA polymerase sigma-70 factor (ECF subfamily)